MLKKITTIRNVGKFKNARASGDTTLNKQTMIFAANGYGKTTLCTILRSLSTGEPEYVIGRKTLGSENDPEIEILMEGGAAVFKKGAWNLNLPDIAVFDGAFIAENVHSGDIVGIEHKRNLYRVIIGREGVGLAKEEERLAWESRAQTGAVTAACNTVKGHVPDGIELNDFIKLPHDPDVDANIMATKHEVAAARQADQIKVHTLLAHLPTPSVPEHLPDVLATTLKDIEKDAKDRVKAHMALHKMQDDGPGWLAKGMVYYDDDTCPYCGQGVKGIPLINAYQTLFGKEYAGLKSKVDALTDEIEAELGERVIGSINTLLEKNKGLVEFWGNYCDLDPDKLTPPKGYGDALTILREATLKLVGNKAVALLESMKLDKDFLEAQTVCDKIQPLISALNKCIDAANVQIEEKKVKAGKVDLANAEERLFRLRAIKIRHEPAVVADCDAYKGAVTTKEKLKQEKAAVREKLEEHTKTVIQPYETQINSYLDKFNAGFSIAETKHGYLGGIASSSYQIVINDTHVDLGDVNTADSEPSFKNTLSTGDRSTLALAFFLAHLDHDPSRAARIVAFDDPFNSQDSFRRTQTVYEIVRTGVECAQVIILSHDAAFLKQVWKKCPRDTRKALQIANLQTQGTKIMPFNMDEACKGRVATEMDDLIAFMNTGAGKGNDIIKKMRVVLETYCRSTYRAYFEAGDNLGGIIKKIHDRGDEHPACPIFDELDQINKYSRDHHHGKAPDNGDAGDLIDQTELAGYVKRTLVIVNSLPA